MASHLVFPMLLVRYPMLLMLLLAFAISGAHAEDDGKVTQVEIQAVLKGAETVIPLPKVTTKDGRTAVVRVVQEIRMPKEVDAEGAPKAFEPVELGIVLTIKPFVADEGIRYSANVLWTTLEEGHDTKPEKGEIRSVRKAFSGTAKNDVQTDLAIKSPFGEPSMLSLKFVLMDKEGRPVK